MIIGWFLLVGSAIAPLGLLMNRAVFPGVQVPLYFLGFFVYGRNAYVVFIMWMAAQMAGAVGLLKLRNWGLFSTIALQCLGAINAALLLVIPGHRARFQQIMETAMASMNARMPQSAPFEFPIWIGFVAVFPMALVPGLWGLWSMFWQWSRERTRLPVGVHGAFLPLLMVPAGAFIATLGGVLKLGATSVTWFNAITLPYTLIALFLAVAMTAYYLAWKYVVGYVNRVLGIA